MPRPKKCRRVGFVPKCHHFVPDDMVSDGEQEVVITIEEIEAIRLSDLEGLEQIDCAEKMGVSRGTFQRVINSSRRKIADALVNGKALRIEGGSYRRNMCRFICRDCGHSWMGSDFELRAEGKLKCTFCEGTEFDCKKEDNSCCKNCCRQDRTPESGN